MLVVVATLSLCLAMLDVMLLAWFMQWWPWP